MRQGKRFELEVDGEITDERLAEVRDAAETLFANTVIETFDVRVDTDELGPRLMAPRIGVVTFPGSLDDQDALRAVRLSGAEPVPLWHGSDTLTGVDAVILPGGFSYGDYLRCGAIARFAPVMTEVIRAAGEGMPVLGICNGFQILCEAHLLPGALIRNERADLRLQGPAAAGRVGGHHLDLGVRAGPGDHHRAQERRGSAIVADAETLARLEGEGRVVFRYLDGNPNGSLHDIAGICNERGNVVGLMPHPEHNVESADRTERGRTAVLRQRAGLPGREGLRSLGTTCEIWGRCRPPQSSLAVRSALRTLPSLVARRRRNVSARSSVQAEPRSTLGRSRRAHTLIGGGRAATTPVALCAWPTPSSNAALTLPTAAALGRARA